MLLAKIDTEVVLVCIISCISGTVWPFAQDLVSLDGAKIKIAQGAKSSRIAENNNGDTTYICVLGGKTKGLPLGNMAKGPPGVPGPAYKVQLGYHGDHKTIQYT